MNTILQTVYTAAGVCLAALILGIAFGLVVDAAVEFVSALRTRRDTKDEIRFVAVDAGEIVDPDEPIPYVLADESDDSGRAVA